MDEKTERLRDIFVDVAGEESLTERQEAGRGSLASEASVEDDLRSLVDEMREEGDFGTPLPTTDLVTLVRQFYDGRRDTAIADDLDVPRETVARARLDLHLVVADDLDPPFDPGAFSDLREAGRSLEAIAEDLDADAAAVRQYARALDAQAERRRVADRFREAFERLLSDRDLAERLTAATTETGLEDATEDAERNVSF